MAERNGSTSTSSIEPEFVNLAKYGDASALNKVFERLYPRIYGYTLARTGNQQISEDLTQDVFLKMCEALPRYEERDLPFSAWVFRIAHNTVVSYQRKENARRITYGISDGSSSVFASLSTESPEMQVETKVLAGEVIKAYEMLPCAQREIIALRFRDGLSVADTAAIMGKNEGNVKVLQHKAITKLRSTFQREAPKNEEGQKSHQGRVLDFLEAQSGHPITTRILADSLKLPVYQVSSIIHSLRRRRKIQITKCQAGYYLESEEIQRLKTDRALQAIA